MSEETHIELPDYGDWAETSEYVTNLGGALSKFQGEMKFAVKSQTNPHFKSKFAGLPETVEACHELIAKFGLAITQTTKPINGRMYLVTRLIHGESGEWIRGWWPLMPQKSSQQALASEHTYARRQAIQGILMIPAADDDGEAAEERHIPESQKVSASEARSQRLESVCSKYEKEINDYLMLNDLIKGGQSFRNVKAKVADEIIKRPQDFLAKVKAFATNRQEVAN